MTRRVRTAEEVLADSRICFFCPVLHVRMFKKQCADRHRRRPERKATRAGTIIIYNDPANLYCQSRKCKTGQRIWPQVPRHIRKQT